MIQRSLNLQIQGYKPEKSSFVLSFVSAVNIERQFMDGLITSEERNIELTKIGAPVAIGLVNAPLGLAVAGDVFTHDVLAPIAIEEAEQIKQLVNDFSPRKSTENIFQVIQNKIQSNETRVEDESNF